MSGKAKAAKTPYDLITEENLRKVLQADKGDHSELLSWNVKDFTKPGDNYASAVTSVEIVYSQKGQQCQASYVVKLNPRPNLEDSRSLINTIFQKEAKFYLDLLPDLNSTLEASGQHHLRLPRCFHANLRPGQEQIYFEDLRQKNYLMYDRKKGLDVPHTILIIRELARIHAASCLLQGHNLEVPLESKHNYLLKDWEYFLNPCSDEGPLLIENHLTTASKILEKVKGYDKAVTWVESLKPKLRDILTKCMQSERFGVVCHGDCWNNNVLFLYDEKGGPKDVMLLDLQACRKASLATDLNYLLYTSLEGSVRRSNLDYILSSYYNSFETTLLAGGTPMFFNEDDLLREFIDKNVVGAYFGMMLVPVILMEQQDVPNLDRDEKDTENLFLEVRERVINMMDRSPSAKQRFLSMFDEFLETGLIPS